MSYTDIVCVFSCDDDATIHLLAQEWLDAIESQVSP